MATTSLERGNKAEDSQWMRKDMLGAPLSAYDVRGLLELDLPSAAV